MTSFCQGIRSGKGFRENGRAIGSPARGTHPSEAAAPPYPAGASSAARAACRSQRARAAGPRRRPPCPRRRRRFPAKLDGRKCFTVPHQIKSVQWAPIGFAAGSGSSPNILGGTVCGKGSVFRRRSPVLAGRTGTPFPGVKRNGEFSSVEEVADSSPGFTSHI